MTYQRRVWRLLVPVDGPGTVPRTPACFGGMKRTNGSGELRCAPMRAVCAFCFYDLVLVLCVRPFQLMGRTHGAKEPMQRGKGVYLR